MYLSKKHYEKYERYLRNVKARGLHWYPASGIHCYYASCGAHMQTAYSRNLPAPLLGEDKKDYIH